MHRTAGFDNFPSLMDWMCLSRIGSPRELLPRLGLPWLTPVRDHEGYVSSVSPRFDRPEWCGLRACFNA